MLYIGVVGQIACGKGVLVDALKEHGFVSFSLSSILHDDLKEKGITDFTRKTLQDMGDELRKKYGRDVLARRAIKKLTSTGPAASFPPVNAPPMNTGDAPCRDPFLSRHPSKFIIEGIRNTAEVEYLKSLKNFTLIGVKAKRSLRFERLLKRKKPWDPKSWNEFLVVDQRDLGIGQDKNGQQVKRCLRYCDYVLINNKDIKDFQRKVKKLLDKIIKFNHRSC